MIPPERRGRIRKGFIESQRGSFLCVIRTVTGKEGQNARFRAAFPSPFPRRCESEEPFSKQSAEDNLPSRGTMKEITQRTCQAPLDLPDSTSPVPIDLQATHSRFSHGTHTWPDCSRNTACIPSLWGVSVCLCRLRRTWWRL